MQDLKEHYICHIIIPSKNLKNSKAFYEQVFGWKAKKQSWTESLDILPRPSKGPSVELNPEADVVMPSIKTIDIEVKLKMIEKIGGTIVQGKTPVAKNPEHGYYAIFKDTEGNQIGLYSEW
ncbi:MAG: hypothetical protein NWF14_01070 [Candidatus Bathyarchaeota archaeon]|nr:hypothetical protein [Candidatus Bathyarchaeota archaeon]